MYLMALTSFLDGRLSIPVVGAPMFILSSPELVIAQCVSGIVGSFPALNARPESELEKWIDRIDAGIAAFEAESGARAAPYAVNLIVHPSNLRLEHDLDVCERRRVPIVITSLSKPTGVVERVHAYGGLVFHDVVNAAQARKALEAGVDGLILVCAGAGGHTGQLNPFAFVEEVRRFYDGTILLSGGISTGTSVHAACSTGADLAYIGTLFIASEEAKTAAAHKHMIVESSAADIVCTDAVTGVPANFLAKSFEAIGLDPADLVRRKGGGLDLSKGAAEAKAWRDVYGGGHGVGTIGEILPARERVARLVAEYEDAVRRVLVPERGLRSPV